jgi:hypothetical protein
MWEDQHARNKTNPAGQRQKRDKDVRRQCAFNQGAGKLSAESKRRWGRTGDPIFFSVEYMEDYKRGLSFVA